jgi:predicted phage-related endonuclease
MLRETVEDVMLRTAGQIEKSVDRRAFIGGSDARIITGDDETALLRLWREKRGEIEPEGLSNNLIVQLGIVTEHLNRHWYERNTGQVVTEVQRRVFHPVKRWMAATLDGVVEGTAQHVGDPVKVGRAIDHNGRRQMGRTHDPCRSALPASTADR